MSFNARTNSKAALVSLGPPLSDEDSLTIFTIFKMPEGDLNALKLTIFNVFETFFGF